MSQLLPCKACKKEVKAGIKTCPHCGQSNPTLTIKMAVISTIIFSLIIGFSIRSCQSTPEEIAANKASADQRECTEGSSAKGFAQVFVKRHLKSPSTADFPMGGGTLTKVSDCRFIVTSYVDSQNGFGATVRSKTQVLLDYSKERESWDMIDISINNAINSK